jgi:AraC-like DNA-binding protein
MGSTIVLDRSQPLSGVRSRLFWEGPCVDGWHEPPRLLYDTLLVITSEGQYTLELDGQVTAMRAGSAVLIPPETWHVSRVAPGGRTIRSCIHFGWGGADLRHLPLMATSRTQLDQRLVQRAPDAVRDRLPLVLDERGMQPARELTALMLRHARAGGPLTDTCLAALVGWMLGAGDARVPAATRDHPALAVKHLIDERYAQPLGYREFMRAARLTRSHLCGTFHRLLGISPTAYLIQVRLHHAARLLRSGAMPIAEVGRAVGIADVNYFTRLFRRHMGLPPHAWRLHQAHDLRGEVSHPPR